MPQPTMATHSRRLLHLLLLLILNILSLLLAPHHLTPPRRRLPPLSNDGVRALRSLWQLSYPTPVSRPRHLCTWNQALAEQMQYNDRQYATRDIGTPNPPKTSHTLSNLILWFPLSYPRTRPPHRLPPKSCGFDSPTQALLQAALNRAPDPRSPGRQVAPLRQHARSLNCVEPSFLEATWRLHLSAI
ncbi:hypothetical protein BD413DRAFT_172890 [Trametes elegans]|nr:hypothetical protein BD413DRAFT_172890 [Trametes elegans]